MTGTSKSFEEIETAKVRLWSFGMGRMSVLCVSPLLFAVGSFLAFQREVTQFGRIVAGVAAFLVGSTASRVFIVPFVLLEQEGAGRPIRFTFTGLLFRKRGPALLKCIEIPNNTWVQFETDVFVLRSPLLTCDRGPKSWGIASSKSEETVLALSAMMSSGGLIDLRTL